MPFRRAYRPRYVPRVKAHRVFPRKKRVTFARRVKKIVKSESEMKNITYTSAFSDLEAASQRVINLSAIGQGDGPKDRVGQAIYPVRIQGRVAVKTTDVCGPVVVRTMIVKCRQCDGTLPTLADILPESNGDLKYLAVDQPLVDNQGAANSYGLPQAKRKFKVIYDKTVILSYASADSSNSYKIFKINKKLFGKTYYIDTTTTGEGNNQYVLMIHTDAADDKVEECHDIRFFYKDP